MIVIYAGWDAVDAMMSHVLLSAGRTALVAYGEVVWSWRPDAGVKSAMMLRITLVTVTNKPGHRGEREISRKTIAQGMPVETGEPVEDYRILCGPRVHRTPGIPCALLLLGRTLIANLGRNAPRERGITYRRPRLVRNCALGGDDGEGLFEIRIRTTAPPSWRDGQRRLHVGMKPAVILDRAGFLQNHGHRLLRRHGHVEIAVSRG